MGIIIGSYNLDKFSGTSDKDIIKICEIIQDAAVDIIAIQEIFKKSALDKLLDELGRREWDGCWDSPKSSSSLAAEGYAFIWKKNKLCLSQSQDGKCFKPYIFDDYSGELIRDPFYGRFELISNSMVELRLINTHIISSKRISKSVSDDSDDGFGAVYGRNRELSILMGKILPYIDDKTNDINRNEVDGRCRKPITILLGDYNLNLKESGARKEFIFVPNIIIREGRSEKNIITTQTDLTTLKKDLSNADTEGAYASNFDHFSYDKNHSIKAMCRAVKSPENPEIYNGDYEQYKERVSNHLLVVMNLEFT